MDAFTSFVTKFDLYGEAFNFRITKTSKQKSILGSVITLLSLAGVAYFIYNMSIDILLGRNSKITINDSLIKDDEIPVFYSPNNNNSSSLSNPQFYPDDSMVVFQIPIVFSSGYKFIYKNTYSKNGISGEKSGYLKECNALGLKTTTIKVDNSTSAYYCIDFNQVILGPQNENSGGIKAYLEVELMSCLVISYDDIKKNNLTCSQILLPTVNFKFSIFMPVYKFDSSNINNPFLKKYTEVNYLPSYNVYKQQDIQFSTSVVTVNSGMVFSDISIVKKFGYNKIIESVVKDNIPSSQKIMYQRLVFSLNDYIWNMERVYPKLQELFPVIMSFIVLVVIGCYFFCLIVLRVSRTYYIMQYCFNVDQDLNNAPVEDSEFSPSQVFSSAKVLFPKSPNTKVRAFSNFFNEEVKNKNKAQDVKSTPIIKNYETGDTKVENKENSFTIVKDDSPENNNWLNNVNDKSYNENLPGAIDDTNTNMNNNQSTNHFRNSPSETKYNSNATFNFEENSSQNQNKVPKTKAAKQKSQLFHQETKNTINTSQLFNNDVKKIDSQISLEMKTNTNEVHSHRATPKGSMSNYIDIEAPENCNKSDRQRQLVNELTPLNNNKNPTNENEKNFQSNILIQSTYEWENENNTNENDAEQEDPYYKVETKVTNANNNNNNNINNNKHTTHIKTPAVQKIKSPETEKQGGYEYIDNKTLPNVTNISVLDKSNIETSSDKSANKITYSLLMKAVCCKNSTDKVIKRIQEGLALSYKMMEIENYFDTLSEIDLIKKVLFTEEQNLALSYIKKKDLFPVDKHYNYFMTNKEKEDKVVSYLAKAKAEDNIDQCDAIIMQNLNKQVYARIKKKAFKHKSSEKTPNHQDKSKVRMSIRD